MLEYSQEHDTESWAHKVKAHKDCHLEAEQEVLENRQMKSNHYTVHRNMHLREKKKLHEVVKRSQKKYKISILD